MKILIAGSTNITDGIFVEKYCVAVASKLQWLYDVRTSDVEIVSVHENRGVMWLVEKWTKKNKIKLKIFSVDWNDITTSPVFLGTNSYGAYNKLAGSNRNTSAVEYMEDSVIGCIAFDDGSKQVKEIVRLSKKKGIPVWQINCENMSDIKIKIWNGEAEYEI